MNFHLRSVSRPDAAAVAGLCGVSGQAMRHAPVVERLSYVLPAFVENRCAMDMRRPIFFFVLGDESRLQEV